MEQFLTNFINNPPTKLVIPSRFYDNVSQLVFPDDNTINIYNKFVKENETDLPKTYSELIDAFKFMKNENPNNDDNINMYLTLCMWQHH